MPDIPLLTPGAIDSALNALIRTTSGDTGASPEDERVAFVFSSRYRSLARAENVDRAQELWNIGLTQAGVNLSGSSVTNGSQNSLMQLDLLAKRAKGGAFSDVVMEVNPNSVEFNQPKRYKLMKTQRGTDVHHFSNRKRQNNDLLTISFRGNTGDISGRGHTKAEREKSIRRFTCWHNLLQLTREETHLADGTQNKFYITYDSALFPLPITFEGVFTSVLKFSEEGAKPNSRNYSMEFLVSSTSPDMDDISSDIITFFTQRATANPLDGAVLL